MATYTRSSLNYLWLAWFALNIPIVLLIDALDFYPSWLYQPADSPLHAIHLFRNDYLDTYNDKVLTWRPETSGGHDSWIQLFLYLEFAFLLPTVIYGVLRLGAQRKGTSGRDELLFLVYAFHTVLTTSVVIYDICFRPDAFGNAATKRQFLFQVIGPWIAIPSLMFFDMASRILGRIRVADAALASKKTR